MNNHYVYKKPYVRLLIGSYDALGSAFRKKRAPIQADPPKRIAAIILHQIGDVVMTLPTLEAIHTMFPQAKLELIVGKGPAALLANNPWQAQVHIFDAAWQKKVQQLSHEDVKDTQLAEQTFLSLVQQRNFDTAVVFHPDLKINQLLGKTTIAQTFGFANAGGGFRLTHPLWMPPDGHQVDRNYSLATAMAQTFRVKAPHMHPAKLSLPNHQTKSLHEKLKELGWPPQTPLVAIHPFASDTARNWQIEKWHELIHWLIEHDYTPVVLGSPHDTFSIPPESQDHCLNLCGQLSLIETAAVIKLATAFIGVNSGPGHIAAALGTPVVSIFSAVNDPKRWAPYGPAKQVRVLYKPPQDPRFPIPANKELELTALPEGLKENPYTSEITSDDVIHTVADLLATGK